MKANSLLSNDGVLVEFRRLPLGAHFSFQGQDGVYVVLDTSGCGLITEFSSELDCIGQRVLSAADAETEASALMVLRRWISPAAVPVASTSLNDKKANAITERDHFVATGYVMTHADGRMCIANGGAVRWLTDKQYFDMMHNADQLSVQYEHHERFGSLRERILASQPVECQLMNHKAVEIESPDFDAQSLSEGPRTISHDEFHAMVDAACTKLQTEDRPKAYWDGVGDAMEAVLAAVSKEIALDAEVEGASSSSLPEMKGIVARLRRISCLLGIESALPGDDVLQESIFAALGMISSTIEAGQSKPETFQSRVAPWLEACFGQQIASNRVERNHRMLEEALELVQACGCSQQDAHSLVDYTFGRPVGDPAQEVGGVMVTLAALCLANDLDMHKAGEAELSRVWGKIDKIREKQAAKPKGSPLPM